jgi:hypothetical protein
MTDTKLAGWPGFKYVPVPEIVGRKTMRSLRTMRRNLQRYFESSGWPEFAARLAAIRANPRNNGERKRILFEALQNDYIAEVRKRMSAAAPPAADPAVVPVAEAAPEVLPESGSDPELLEELGVS